MKRARGYVLALCALGSSVAACADLLGFKDLHEAADSGGGGDAAPDVAPADAYVDPCSHARWPGPPDASLPGTAAEYDMAIQHLYFTTTPDGGVGDFGYDLDDKCTTDLKSASCQGPLVTDDPNGRDNSSIQLMGTLASIVTSINDTQVNTAIGHGDFTIVLRLLGLRSLVDQQLKTGLLLGVQSSPGLEFGGTPNFDGNDRWNVAVEDSVSPSSNIPNPTNDGYVTGGVLVSTATGTISLRVLLPAGGAIAGPLLVTLRNPLLTGTLVQTDAGVGMIHGVIAGRWKASDMLAAIADLTAAGSVAVCDYLNGNAFGIVKSKVCAARDINSSGTDDDTAACDAVSVALTFDAVPAQVASTPVSFPASSTPCGHDAGACDD